MEVEVQLSNNEGVTPGLNFPEQKKKNVLSYFKTKRANLAKAKEELQAKQVACKNDITQIILGHLLRMLN